MSRGFVILAVDKPDSTVYLNCANALKASIVNVMPEANVSIFTMDDLPEGDLAPNSDWKLINDVQVYELSPYDETIKLEADMYIPRSIEHWFDVLGFQDIAICTKIRNYRQEISDQRFYRRFLDDNNLPDTYNAITYFKKTDTSKQFFDIVRDVFVNWDSYKAILKCNPSELATTDWAYAIASHIIGVDKTTMPMFDEFSMVHMKRHILGAPTENWTDTFIYEIYKDQLRVSTFVQEYPFHYHIKNFSDKIIKGISNGQ
jgi:hypothetical protein